MPAQAVRGFLEFFAATIRNKNTRVAYAAQPTSTARQVRGVAPSSRDRPCLVSQGFHATRQHHRVELSTRSLNVLGSLTPGFKVWSEPTLHLRDFQVSVVRLHDADAIFAMLILLGTTMAVSQIVRKIVVNGIAMNCCLVGPEPAPVVMFGNGRATGTAMWEPQADHFSERFRVLRYDVRGHGETEATPPPYSIEQLADDAVDLLDQLSMDKVAYVGLSLGGMIGQSLAVRHPHRVGSLVLCDTTMHSPRAMWSERIAAIKSNGLEPQVEPSIERWFSRSFCSSQPELVDNLRAMIRATSLHGYLGCAMAMRDMHLESVAPRIVQPTLLIVGRDDRSTPVAAAQALHTAIAGSQLEVIEQAAHLPNIEQASRFNAVLARFLDTYATT